jgi:hypothetical protein
MTDISMFAFDANSLPFQLETIWVIDCLASKRGYREPSAREQIVISNCLQKLDLDIAALKNIDNVDDCTKGFLSLSWSTTIGKKHRKPDVWSEHLSEDERFQLYLEFLTDIRSRLARWLTRDEHMWETNDKYCVVKGFLLDCYGMAAYMNFMDNRGHPRSLHEHGLIDDPNNYR